MHWQLFVSIYLYLSVVYRKFGGGGIGPKDDDDEDVEDAVGEG